MLENLTPNDILRSFAMVKEKKIQAELGPDHRLPLQGQFEVVGLGDWGNGRSTKGSQVLKNDGHVVKVHLGEMGMNVFQVAEDKKRGVGMFKEVSLPTLIAVAIVDECGPKPITIQKRVDGFPACDTPFLTLLKKETLVDLKKIVRVCREVYEKEHVVDFLGQRISSSTFFKLICTIPFFSDNIMVDKNGRAYFVDNTPYITNREKITPLKERMYWRSIFFASEMLLTLLLGSVKLPKDG